MKNSFVVPFNISDYLPGNIKEISKDLRVPINEDYLNEIRSMASYASSNVLNTFPQESIKELRRSVQSLSASYLPAIDSTSSLRKSLNNFSNLFTSNIHQPISSQMFDDTLASMRYYTSTNNHIKLQWKKLINTELSDDFISSFRDISNATKLSSLLGLSEDDIKQMQGTINDAYSNDDGSIDHDGALEAVATSYHLDNKQDDGNVLSNVNKSSHVFPLYLFITILNFILSTGFFIDGTINDNKKELVISYAIEKSQSIVDISKNELKK